MTSTQFCAPFRLGMIMRRENPRSLFVNAYEAVSPGHDLQRAAQNLARVPAGVAEAHGDLRPPHPFEGCVLGSSGRIVQSDQPTCAAGNRLE